MLSNNVIVSKALKHIHNTTGTKNINYIDSKLCAINCEQKKFFFL